jgi:hypothetical protein
LIRSLIPLLIAVMIGMIFAGWLRSLPLLGSLPKY